MAVFRKKEGRKESFKNANKHNQIKAVNDKREFKLHESGKNDNSDQKSTKSSSSSAQANKTQNFKNGKEFKNKKRTGKFRNNSNKEEKPERGPTKRELREELSKPKKLSEKKRSKPEHIESKPESAAGVIKTDKKKVKNEKVKQPRPLKKKRENVSKVFYTPENINSYLLEAKSSESLDKVTNMLLFVLKNYKSNPSEVLAKVKILTSDKRVNTEGDNVQMAVLKHICVFYKFDGPAIQNLFKMINTNTLFSKYLSDYIFSAPYDSEQYDCFFNEIFTEICRVSEKSASLSFNDFIGYFYEIDSCESIENYKADDFESGPEPIQDECEVENTEAHSSEEEILPAKEESSDASTISLVSLNDDEEIDRLDRTLGKMFGKGMLSIQEQSYINNLLGCFETLIKSNIHVKIDNLIRILYLTQFESISQKLKFVVKDFLSKIGDKCRVFRIFQICALINPSVYSLYNTFYSFCDISFDLKKFMICVFNFGHEDFIINKIDKDAFYLIYNSTLGKSFDDFLILLIQSEKREDKLREMENVYFNDEIKQAIQEAILNLSEMKKKKSKQNEKKDPKETAL